MTSDSNPPDSSQEAPQESSVENAMANAKAAFQNSGFSTPTGMVALGSLILLGSWVLFSFILEWSGYIGHLAMTAAFVAVVLYFGKASWTSSVGSKAALIKGCGWIMVFMGAIELLWTIRHSSFYGAEQVIPFLTYMTGYAVAFLGARAIEA